MIQDRALTANMFVSMHRQEAGYSGNTSDIVFDRIDFTFCHPESPAFAAYAQKRKFQIPLQHLYTYIHVCARILFSTTHWTFAPSVPSFLIKKNKIKIKRERLNGMISINS